jgi:hypothetical protein
LIRPVEQRDLPRIKELAKEADWEIDDAMLCGFVAVNEQDEPVQFAGAWLIAEVHVALDKNWSTPAMRLLLLKQVHDEMRKELKRCGIRQAVTWFDNTRNRFMRRLESWGWVKSEKVSWHRGIF